MKNQFTTFGDGTVGLLDDCELKDWNLDLESLQGIELNKVRIPYSKVLWLKNNLPSGVKMQWGRQMPQEDIEMVKVIIKKEFNNFEDMTDIEKVVAVDSFLQREIQYVGCDETCVNGIKYRASDPKIDEFNKAAKPDKKLSRQPYKNQLRALDPLTGNTLERHRGICADFSCLATLLLNNPVAKIACYTFAGSGHGMNTIVLNGKIYCLDSTQNVLTGKNRFQTPAQPSGVLQSSSYNYGATLRTAEELDVGGELRKYNEHDCPTPSGMITPRGYSEPSHWWKAELNRKNALEESRQNGTDPMHICGINENYLALTSKYPHAESSVPREQIESAILSLKQKGFGHLFEYPKQPYYRQIGETVLIERLNEQVN